MAFGSETIVRDGLTVLTEGQPEGQAQGKTYLAKHNRLQDKLVRLIREIQGSYTHQDEYQGELQFSLGDDGAVLVQRPGSDAYLELWQLGLPIITRLHRDLC